MLESHHTTMVNSKRQLNRLTAEYVVARVFIFHSFVTSCKRKKNPKSRNNKPKIECKY